MLSGPLHAPLLALLTLPAHADVATPDVVGANAPAPWDDAAHAPDAASEVRATHVAYTIDTWPTITHVTSTWALAGAPGAVRVLAWPIDAPYGATLLPLEQLDVRVGDQTAETREYAGTWCPLANVQVAAGQPCPRVADPGGDRPRPYRWILVPVPFDAQGAATLTITYDQLADGNWYAYDSAALGFGVSALLEPQRDTFASEPLAAAAIVPAADVVWTLHGLPVANFQFLPPPTVTADDRVEWHVTDGSLRGVVGLGHGLQPPALDAAVLPPDVSEILRLEDDLARLVYTPGVVPPEAWLARVNALRAAVGGKDEDLARVAEQALNDLHTRVLQAPLSVDRDRAAAWLDPGEPVAGTGILARPDVGGFLDEGDIASLIDAAALAERSARLRFAATVTLSVGGSVLLGVLFLRGRRPA